MSQRTQEQKKLALQLIFAKKSPASKSLIVDHDAVARRRRIEELEEQKRFDAEFAL